MLTEPPSVANVTVDAKDLVTVKETMDVKDLLMYLKEKLKRNVEVVYVKKGGEKKENKKVDDGNDGEKKENKEVNGG